MFITALKVKLSIKDFFSKCNQIHNCRFAHIYWRNRYWKTSFFVEFVFFKLCKHRMVALHKKWSFPLRISSVNVTKSATTDLPTFTEETLIGKLHFFVQCMFFKLLKHSMVTVHKKWSFPIRIFSVADLVTFTEEILNGKLHFLCVSNTYKTNLTKLSSQLKHACRIIFYEHKFIHTQALLKKLNIFQINMKPPSSVIK